jgi:hypothetical protein
VESEVEEECRIECTDCHCTCFRTPLTAVMVMPSAGGQKGALSSVATAIRREKSFSSTVTVVTGDRREERKGEGREGNQTVGIIMGVSCRILNSRRQRLKIGKWLAAAIATFAVICFISLLFESHTSLALLLLGALSGSQ